MVAALVIIPACFSYGLDVGAGPSLLFVTLPTILQDIPLGQLFAVILYIAMIFAGVSSLQNMFEAVAESLQNRFPRLSRTATLIILAVLCLGFGIGMETISQWGPWMDLVSIYIIPIGATLGAVSWFYVMKKRRAAFGHQYRQREDPRPPVVWHRPVPLCSAGCYPVLRCPCL